MRLSGREQVSHKTLSEPVGELELYGFAGVERKGRGRGRGVDFYISPTGSVERKAFVERVEGSSIIGSSKKRNFLYLLSNN